MGPSGQSFGGPDLSGIFVLFVVLAVFLSITGFLMRMRNGVPYGQRRYRYRTWFPGAGMMGGPMPMRPGQPWDPMRGDPAMQYGAMVDVAPQVDPFASAPGCDPAQMGGGGDAGVMGGSFGSCDPGGGGMASPPMADAGGGTAGSIPS
jgi:hypothetical protein